MARAARLLGAPAVIVMPSDAPADQAGAGRGGRRRRSWWSGPPATSASGSPRRIAGERSLSVIPPFDDDRIIAGQGTIGLELVEDLPDLAAVLVPIGGGGLASGVATAIKALRPSVRVIGVEPELGADARDSLARGEIVRWPSELASRTIADGTRTQALGVRTFAHLRAYLDEIVTVTEVEIAAGVRLAAERSRLVVEPSGALSIAAMAFHAAELGLDGIGWLDRGRRERRATSTRSATGSTWRRRSRSWASAPGAPAPAGPRYLGASPRSSASRSASRRSRTRIWARSRSACRSDRAMPRASDRIQPATRTMIAARKIASPAIHITPAASRWSASGSMPYGRPSVA